jgi:hypothetical protein
MSSRLSSHVTLPGFVPLILKPFNFCLAFIVPAKILFTVNLFAADGLRPTSEIMFGSIASVATCPRSRFTSPSEAARSCQERLEMVALLAA